jgi:hypothetical protein
MKIISNEMCSMQIVGVCGTFCMETDKKPEPHSAKPVQNSMDQLMETLKFRT